MKSLRDQILGKCVHFNGIQHKTCEVGVAYADVKDPASKLLRQWPCFSEGPTERCLRVQFPTEAEADAHVAEFNAAFAAVIDRQKRGECIHCGAKVSRFTQSGHCAYAEPCGHRHGQADAKALNSALGRQGGKEPESPSKTATVDQRGERKP